MKDKLITRLKKKMEAGAKAIAVGDKAIEAIKLTQTKVVDDFNKSVIATVKEAEKEITYHQNIIAEAEGLAL